MSSSVLPRRGYIGLTLASKPERRGDASGLLVRAVALRSDAESAGIRPGDLLVSIDQNPVTDLAEVRSLLRGLWVGNPLLLDVLRSDVQLTLEARVSEYPLEQHAGARTLLDQVRGPNGLLRAIAVVPDTRGPHPVLYYLPGAHWASEEYPLAPEHPIPALASALVLAGIATLRVERSGTGDSEGPPCTRVDFEQELAGYAAGLSWLRSLDWADRERVFLFGHSLGAMVAPLLAENTSVSGIVTFGASAIPISDALVGALLRHASRQPESAESSERMALVTELVRLVVAGETPARVFEARPDLARAAPEHFGPDEAYHRSVRFYHQLERQDLLGAWSRIRCPMLAMHGELDVISTLEDSERIAKIAGPDARVLELAGVDHQFSVLTDTGQRLAPSVRDACLSWLRARI